ncbi:F-box protein PP2-A13-like [Impatiens glandulifera]|uniref:F-box protein PP2-A13-like n=1 Tax=Impatiens glandulifera TaxID=253017 RepID=UPI001FB187A8|nr:F-box protein PP2-A13-like [Impatiens glandulifera]
MGANASACLQSYPESSSSSSIKSKPRLEDIPENCIALVLTHLTPPEICKLAQLNRAFRAAASSDFIWDSKLPSNYRYILEKLSNNKDLSCLGKKGLYGNLCHHNPFDGGTREIWVDKKTGGVCLLISSRALTITGIDDRRYWTHLPTEESRFQTIAYLQQTWWLEVVGDIDFQLPSGCYSLFFRLQLGRASKRLGRRVCNLDHIHGWNIKPVQFHLTTSDGQHVTSKCFLNNPGNWMHYHVGDFLVVESHQSMRIKFSLTQIDCTHTKGGVCIDSVLICPVSLGKELRVLL